MYKLTKLTNWLLDHTWPFSRIRILSSHLAYHVHQLAAAREREEWSERYLTVVRQELTSDQFTRVQQKFDQEVLRENAALGARLHGPSHACSYEREADPSYFRPYKLTEAEEAAQTVLRHEGLDAAIAAYKNIQARRRQGATQEELDRLYTDAMTGKGNGSWLAGVLRRSMERTRRGKEGK